MAPYLISDREGNELSVVDTQTQLANVVTDSFANGLSYEFVSRTEGDITRQRIRKGSSWISEAARLQLTQ